MSYAQWRNSYTCLFVHLGIILMFVFGFYSDLSGRLGLCIFSFYVYFRYCALVWFSNFLNYLVFHFFISLKINS
jgi:hypothetical protein